MRGGAGRYSDGDSNLDGMETADRSEGFKRQVRALLQVVAFLRKGGWGFYGQVLVIIVFDRGMCAFFMVCVIQNTSIS